MGYYEKWCHKAAITGEKPQEMDMGIICWKTTIQVVINISIQGTSTHTVLQIYDDGQWSFLVNRFVAIYFEIWPLGCSEEDLACCYAISRVL